MKRSEAYSAGQVCRLCGLPESRLRDWERRGLVAPSLDSHAGRAYSFQDLVGVRTLVRLTGAGVPLASVERILTSLRSLLPEVRHPLAELRIEVEGRSRVLVSYRSSLLEPGGQLVLRFEERSRQAARRRGRRVKARARRSLPPSGQRLEID